MARTSPRPQSLQSPTWFGPNTARSAAPDSPTTAATETTPAPPAPAAAASALTPATDSPETPTRSRPSPSAPPPSLRRILVAFHHPLFIFPKKTELSLGRMQMAPYMPRLWRRRAVAQATPPGPLFQFLTSRPLT